MKIAISKINNGLSSHPFDDEKIDMALNELAQNIKEAAINNLENSNINISDLNEIKENITIQKSSDACHSYELIFKSPKALEQEWGSLSTSSKHFLSEAIESKRRTRTSLFPDILKK